MTTVKYRIKKTMKSIWSRKDKTDISDLLDRLGRDGWELAEVVPENTTDSFTGFHFFFKSERF